MKSPLDAFVAWFDGIPLPVRHSLTHIFYVITTEDTSRMAQPRTYSLEQFRTWAVSIDFPLRIAARIFYIRSVFDLIIFHHHEIFQKKTLFGPSAQKSNILNLSGPQWMATRDSWHSLRQKDLSDSRIHTWTSWMIRLHHQK
jgi:hypothetical protein